MENLPTQRQIDRIVFWHEKAEWFNRTAKRYEPNRRTVAEMREIHKAEHFRRKQLYEFCTKRFFIVINEIHNG